MNTPDPAAVAPSIQDGLAHHRAGRLPEAEAAYRGALAAQPDHPDALHLLGVIAHQVGRHDAAVELIGKAIAVQPGVAEFHNNLGNALSALDRHDGAIAAFRRAGELRPDFAEALNGLGIALRESGETDAALDAFRKAAAVEPAYPPARNNLANVLRETGAGDEAIAILHRLTGRSPDYAPGHNSLGSALQDAGDFETALAAYRQAIAISPDLPEARNNAGMLLMLLGDYPAGFEGYEWRWKVANWPAAERPSARPPWDGGALGGRIILLHAEQGLGDTVQFLRYAPLVAAKGGRVVIEAPEPAARLAESVSGVAAVSSSYLQDDDFDVHAPLLSLPHLLGTTLKSVPADVPYVSARPDEVETWRRRIGDRGGLNIGLTWGSNPKNQVSRRKSVPLDSLRPLFAIPGTRFFSLQVDERVAEIGAKGLGDVITDLSPHISDLADTAAALAALDLLISIDTVTAHLGGALGLPVWMFTAWLPDWRWMLEREDSPWYPTMRLFRQPRRDEWAPVIARLGGELAALAGGDRSRLDPVRWSGPPAVAIGGGG